MAVSDNEMWNLMKLCNGQIRVMAGRYGGGWLAAGCAVVQWDFDEEWDDLVGGDSEYFNAREFFNSKEDVVLIEYAESALAAFDACAARLADDITRP